jgi:protein associated with RNAse G/E
VVKQPPILILAARFDEDIEHDLLGKISKGTVSTEYYWLDRWYNIFRFSDGKGLLRNFYCNINLPPVFDGQVLSYVDLDIDVLVAPDFSYRVLDFDDFEENAREYSYPADVIENAQHALTELISLVESRAFPFDT